MPGEERPEGVPEAEAPDAEAPDAGAAPQPAPDKKAARAAAKEQKAREKARAKAEKEALRTMGKGASGQDLVHSGQLHERMRRGDAEATPKDRRLRVVFDALMVLGFLLLVSVLLGKVGLPVRTTISLQTLTLAVAAVVLGGASFVFTQVHWRALRKPQGARALDRSRSDLLLTTVSIAALFTVVMMVLIEVLALLVFTGVLDFGNAGERFADNFILFQTIMLLVYLMALVVREGNVSTYVPTDAARLAAKVLPGVAAPFVLLGVLLSYGIPQSVGVLADLSARQGVYFVTLGILLEFMAMRVRMRLPSVVSRFKEAVELSHRANEEMRVQLQKRAQRSYLLAMFFVVGSMAFAGASVTGNIPGLGNTRAAIAIVVFYVGAALIILGLIAVRVLQSRQLQRDTGYQDSTMEDLLSRKRKSPEEIFRIAVYSVAGVVGLVCLVLAVVVGTGQMSDQTQEERPVLDEDGDPVEVRGEPQMETVTVEHGVHPKYGTDLFLLGLLFAGGPFGYFYNRERKRIEAIDEKFPDFLRDLAESARAGMTLPRALVTASQGTYGALTPEIRKMAAQVEWGVDFKDALERFAQRARTRLIDRTVSLVVEAQRAGGNVVDVLTAASEDAREIKQIVSERDEQMNLYKVVIYIAYFVFIAVVLILSAQFIPAFKDAVSAAEGQQVGGLQFKAFDPEDFNTLFFHAALVQAIGGGLVGGVLTRGNPLAGLGSISVMVIAAWVSFRFIVGVLI